MRLKFEFILTKNQLPLDYRKIFISLFKTAINRNNDCSSDEYYHQQDPIFKSFTFSILLDKPNFYKDYIEVASNKVILYYSTPCYKTGLDYYNSLVKMLNYAYPIQNDNHLILKNIVSLKEKKVIQDTILIKTMSPILIRKHDREKNFDTYLTPVHENFSIELRKNLVTSLENSGYDDMKFDIEDLEFIDIGKGKEVKVLFYKHKVLGIIGKYVLKGNPRLLDFIVKAGIGSRTSSGFGMIDIVEVSG